jgi:bifunctional UDP-N-acetylglucosamine pyrophosphorylase/glucosamine-1-phosphate N-acetyltransferase
MTKHKTAIPTAAIILAAGKGTRMKSALPKVMHCIAAQPMVVHAAQQAVAAGLAPLCVVVAPGMDAVSRAVQTVAADARTAVQHEALGTGHAVRSAREALAGFDGNLIVLYGDTPLVTAATIENLSAALSENPRNAVAVLGFTPADAGAYGRLVVEDGVLARIVEAKEASPQELAIPLCNSGVIALRGDVAWGLLEKITNANAKGEYYLTDVVALAVAAGDRAVVVEAAEDEVLGVNSRVELAQAEAIFQQRAREKHMLAGVTLLDPASVYFSADTDIAPDVLVEPHVFFGPGVVIGSGAHIKAFSHIEGTVIGEQAIIGPFARLRPGSNIGAEVKIGNFVEIKKSDIQAGAKISHLSYIGDATVGEDANIGAGTITCNYDGYNKYRTEIGRDVFVGSNSALVAPVRIGDGAMVAAGSVITQDIEADALALARSRQEQKADWAKAFRDKNKK